MYFFSVFPEAHTCVSGHMVAIDEALDQSEA